MTVGAYVVRRSSSGDWGAQTYISDPWFVEMGAILRSGSEA